jgi:hypothetical protein
MNVRTTSSTILLKLAANSLQHVLEKWVECVRSALLAREGTLKKRSSPHLDKVLPWSNKVESTNFSNSPCIIQE